MPFLDLIVAIRERLNSYPHGLALLLGVRDAVLGSDIWIQWDTSGDLLRELVATIYIVKAQSDITAQVVAHRTTTFSHKERWTVRIGDAPLHTTWWNSAACTNISCAESLLNSLGMSLEKRRIVSIILNIICAG